MTTERTAHDLASLARINLIEAGWAIRDGQMERARVELDRAVDKATRARDLIVSAEIASQPTGGAP